MTICSTNLAEHGPLGPLLDIPMKTTSMLENEHAFSLNDYEGMLCV